MSESGGCYYYNWFYSCYDCEWSSEIYNAVEAHMKPTHRYDSDDELVGIIYQDQTTLNGALSSACDSMVNWDLIFWKYSDLQIVKI